MPKVDLGTEVAQQLMRTVDMGSTRAALAAVGMQSEAISKMYAPLVAANVVQANAAIQQTLSRHRDDFAAIQKTIIASSDFSRSLAALQDRLRSLDLDGLQNPDSDAGEDSPTNLVREQQDLIRETISEIDAATVVEVAEQLRDEPPVWLEQVLEDQSARDASAYTERGEAPSFNTRALAAVLAIVVLMVLKSDPQTKAIYDDADTYAALYLSIRWLLEKAEKDAP